MSSPFFNFNSDLSTSVIVIFQFMFFVLRESFRGGDEAADDDDLDRNSGEEVDFVVGEVRNGVCSNGVSQYRSLLNTQKFARHSTAGVVTDAVKFGLPLVIIEDFSNVDVNENSCGSNLCQSCMQIKRNGMDRLPNELVVRRRDQKSKRESLFETFFL